MPEVTSDDNGKILKVVDGAWDKDTISIPEVRVKGFKVKFGTVQGVYQYQLDGSTQLEVYNTIKAGILPFFYYIYDRRAIMNIWYFTLGSGTHWLVGFDGNVASGSQISLWDIEANGIFTRKKTINLESIPTPTAELEGAVLKVVDGKWTAVLPDA